MPIHFEHTRECLKQFDFRRLFVEELGWSNPSRRKVDEVAVKESRFNCRQIAELSGAVVLEVDTVAGQIPDAKMRAAVYKEIVKRHHENLLIFVDRDRMQSLWYWVKRQNGKALAREHLFCNGQPADLFLTKLSQMVFDLSDFDAEGNVSVVEVAHRLRSALDVEQVTKKFFREFQEQHVVFLALIKGISDDRQRRWYASVLLNRLMFIYFLQKKPPGFLDGGNQNYLRDKLEESKARGKNRYYSEFLTALFFEGCAKPEEKRTDAAKRLLGDIRYLNGGLFLQHQIEQQNPKIQVSDQAFENLFDLFDRYSWHLDDTPGGKADEINPDVLGYIFEKYINQKAFGAYYTRTEITEYLCERTIHQLILDAVNTPDSVNAEAVKLKVRKFATLGDLLMNLDTDLCRKLVNTVLPGLSLLDPACGSGAFLVAAMKQLINIYSAVIGRIKFLSDRNLTVWLKKIEKEHASIGYYIKKRIITDNLYGVDIMEEATEIARLRLFLALVASATKVEDLEPLPNIDFNVLPGNSLIGLIRVREEQFDKKFQTSLYRRRYKDVLIEKNRLIENYRHTSDYAEDLTLLRNSIEQKRQEASETLNEILFEEFRDLGVKYEHATWDDARKKEGKPVKRTLKQQDIDSLHPFHWAFEFDEILIQRGGFDAIITNPPWEVFKPNGKEFFLDYSDEVSRKNMTIHEFEEVRDRLLEDSQIRAAWVEYLSQFPYQSAYFRAARQYKNQISVVNGKKAGTDINLYKLFTEQCMNLLRSGGRCGMITPSGIYSDLGTTQLRECLYSECSVDSLFGLSNERFLFEGVDHRFKICIFSFQKGGQTESITAAFRSQPREAVRPEDLDRFLHDPHEHVQIRTDLIRRLSPDSLSVMEFKSDLDVQIAEKMLRFPLLGEQIEDSWNVKFTAEFHMTNDSGLFYESPGKGRLPLYEGKMIHQYDHLFAKPRYWVSESEGRKSLLGRQREEDQLLDYQCIRLGFRDIARSTDSRTMICSMIPAAFHGNKIPTVMVRDSAGNIILDSVDQLCLCGIWNSFVLDWILRMKVSATLNFYILFQLPVPRLSKDDSTFAAIVNRSAKLTCTTPEFDGLAKDAGIKSHKSGVTDTTKRAQLRAELDGIIAHLYGLTESEFAHVLETFPLVPDPVKVAAQNAYRDVERGLLR